jgi:hypothetical protein
LSDVQFNTLAVLYTAQTSLVTFFVLAGVLIMVFAEPPLRWFAGGSPYRGHWLVGAAALVLIIAYYILLLWPGLRSFFELVPLPTQAGSTRLQAALRTVRASAAT